MTNTLNKTSETINPNTKRSDLIEQEELSSGPR